MFRLWPHPPDHRPCFPRIRGDVPETRIITIPKITFSPHTRGCSALSSPQLAVLLVFPAYAGMFLFANPSIMVAIGFPRIRGDVPVSLMLIAYATGFSPHTRGCSGVFFFGCLRPNVFPAYAGMFRKTFQPRRSIPRFPRIRGDIPEARPAMRKILLKKYSQQGSLFSFQTFRSGDHIKLAPTFTKPKVDFLCPN